MSTMSASSLKKATPSNINNATTSTVLCFFPQSIQYRVQFRFRIQFRDEVEHESNCLILILTWSSYASKLNDYAASEVFMFDLRFSNWGRKALNWIPFVVKSFICISCIFVGYMDMAENTLKSDLGVKRIGPLAQMFRWPHPSINAYAPKADDLA